MMIRGQSTENPVLLFLAGGPGGTELRAMRHHGQALEQNFVMVTWDQHGTGMSAAQLEPTSTLTLDRAVSDTIEGTNHLRDRFGQDEIYLLGQPWGTILGVGRWALLRGARSSPRFLPARQARRPGPCGAASVVNHCVRPQSGYELKTDRGCQRGQGLDPAARHCAAVSRDVSLVRAGSIAPARCAPSTLTSATLAPDKSARSRQAPRRSAPADRHRAR